MGSVRSSSALVDRAEEALSDPRVRRRGSFSNRRRSEAGGGDGASQSRGAGQASLSDF